MFSVVHQRRRPQVTLGAMTLGAWVLVMSCQCTFLINASAGAEPLPPMPVLAEAVAASQQEMKPYTDAIGDTSVTFDLVPIPGGKFVMGSPPNEADRDSDEGPQHEVEIAPFWMGKHEVTWNEYEMWAEGLDITRRQVLRIKSTERDKLADAITRPTAAYTDMSFGMGKGQYPAICMTQLAAKKYCEWLTAKTGRYYRLPTEAEWEYACRAGTKTAYSFGDDPARLDDYAWYFDNSDEAYHRVGLKKPNPWGLYDMHGNVAEHVLDKYDPAFYQQCAARKLVTNPYNQPTELENRGVRGGSWDDDPAQLRSAARRGSTPEWKHQDPQIPQSQWYYTDAQFCGFRIVRPLAEPQIEEKAKYGADKIQQYNDK